MTSGSVTVPAGNAVAPLNFIYACSVCGYTLADVYEGRHETVEGLSDGINPKDRLVTHLYLASCCHVFCGSHLEGGAPNFHPEGQRPRAPCPTCVKEKNDHSVRDLYSIRGFQKSEHDPLIPPAWFVAPPMNLEGNSKEMEALRFQYLALIRYCQTTHAMRKPLQTTLAESENKLTAVQEVASQQHAKLLTLQEENERLQRVEQESKDLKAEVERLQGVDQEAEQYRRLDVNPKDLETFKNNKDAIRHYLKLVPTLIEQNAKMRERLSSLGFAMALEPVPNLRGYNLDLVNDDGGINGDYYGTSGTTLRSKTTSSHTAGNSAHTSGEVGRGPSSPFAQRPTKRQRVDSPLPSNMQVESPLSRDLMPPPNKPLSKMRSARSKIIPTLRKKFSSSRSIRPQEYEVRRSDDVCVDGYDEQTCTPRKSAAGDCRDTDHYPDDSFYMTGALPVEHSSHDMSSRKSQMPSSISVDNDGSDFTFRAPTPQRKGHASDVNQRKTLPTEPSYIRLMDGLSSGEEVELGLKDPRDNTSSIYTSMNGGSLREMPPNPITPGPRRDYPIESVTQDH
ncbi:hypothetical protein ACEQ8H_001613 [Pleosporales sp. CAS-2024a]